MQPYFYPTDEDIKGASDAFVQGYRHIRIMRTFVGAQETDRRVQVRVGADIETGREKWEDLKQDERNAWTTAEVS